jgi:hypothetical protein
VRRASLALFALLAAALLVGCGGGGDRTATVGSATVTIPSSVHGAKAELTALLEQFPYQHWFTACVTRRFQAAGEPGDGESEAELLAKDETACERSAHGRRPVDPNASSEELDLLRAELAPSMKGLAESHHLGASQSACLTQAFEKLPDRFIVKYGNGDQKTRDAILSIIFKTCAKAR